MQRRQFLAAGLATAVASRRLIAERLPSDVKITRIVGFTLPSRRPKLVGFYMQLHVGRAITNFYRAEHDPLSSDLLIAEGYRIENGTCTVPDAPGFGLKLDEQKLGQQSMAFDLKL